MKKELFKDSPYSERKPLGEVIQGYCGLIGWVVFGVATVAIYLFLITDPNYASALPPDTPVFHRHFVCLTFSASMSAFLGLGTWIVVGTGMFGGKMNNDP